MPLVLADRVRDTTTTTGTGTVTLSGTAPTGYQNFSVIGNGNTTYYTINAGSQWEVGIGTYSSTGPTLSRDTVLESSNANALVNFSAGVKDVFVTYPSDKSVIQDASGNVGIGVSSPGTRLDVLSSSDTPANFRSAGANTYIRFINSVNTEGYIGYLSSDLTFWTTSERMRINSSGNVGVGVTPLTRLDVATSGGSRIRTDTSNSLLVTQTITNAAANAYVTSRTDAFDYQIYTGGSEKARIDSSGNVGIGTSAPGARLDVNGSVRFVDSSAAGPDLLFGNIGGGTAINNVANARNHYGAFEHVFTNFDNSVERMRINSSGNVGIGTASPGSRLDVIGRIGATNVQCFLFNSATGTYGSFQHNGTVVGDIGTANQVVTGGSNTDFALTARSATALVLGTNSTERMRIDSSGNVGIGTSSPAARLDVSGNIVLSNGADRRVRIGSSTNYFYDLQTTGDNFQIIEAGTTPRLTISYPSGNVGIGTSSPSVRLDVVGTSRYTFNVANSYTLLTSLNAAGSAFVDAYTNGLSHIWQTSGTERMRITAAGDVGIGTSSPSQPLHISVPAAGIFVNSSGQGTASLWMAGNSGSASLTQFGGELRFNTGGSANTAASGATERMRINSSGNVGIGTSSQEARLQVRQDLDGTTGVIIQNRNGSGTPVASLRFITGGLDLSDNRWAGITSQGVTAADLRFFTSSGGPFERMRITSGGNVGIGNTDPGYRLDITAGDTTAGLGYAMRLRSNATAAAATLQFTNNGVTAQNGLIACTDTGLITVQGDGASSAIAFRTNGSERARINSDGNLLVGTTAPLGGNTSSEYRVTTADSWPLTLNANNRGLLIRNSAASSGFYAYFEYNNGPNNNGSISWSGGATSYNTTSDARIKDNIVDAPEAGDLIDGIKVRSWDFKADGAHWRYGMVAQELLEVAPEAVSVPADEDMMMGVDYSKLVPMLIKEVQSLRARVAQLEGK